VVFHRKPGAIAALDADFAGNQQNFSDHPESVCKIFQIFTENCKKILFNWRKMG